MVSLDDTVRMMNTLYIKKTGDYLPKTAELKLVYQEDKKLKVIGKVIINLAIYCNRNSIDQIFPIQKSTDKNAQLNFSIASTPLKLYTGRMPHFMKEAPEIEEARSTVISSSFVSQLANSIIIESREEDDVAEELYEEISRMKNNEDHLRQELNTLSHERDHYKTQYEETARQMQILQTNDATGIQTHLEKVRSKK